MFIVQQRWAARAVASVLIVALAVAGLGASSVGALEPESPPPQAPAEPAASAATTPIAEGLTSPLQIATTDHGEILVGQSFAGTLSVVRRDGSVRDLLTVPGESVTGVAPGPFGSVLFTQTVEDQSARVRYRDVFGGVHTLANTFRFEERHNPDSVNTYGFEDISAQCAAELPPDIGPPSYEGGINSNPYALLPTLFGVIVADAGANAVLLIDWAGRVHVLAVLPPQPGVVTADAAAELGLPECAIGLTYLSEPVPTDVEMTYTGDLLISTLAGGISAGSVYRLNPFTGSLRQMATGFAGAANLAIGPNGTVYVSELFGGRVSRIVNGGPELVAEVPEPAALEWNRGRLIVGSGVFGPGSLLSLTP